MNAYPRSRLLSQLHFPIFRFANTFTIVPRETDHFSAPEAQLRLPPCPTLIAIMPPVLQPFFTVSTFVESCAAAIKANDETIARRESFLMKCNAFDRSNA